jgi:hypothetical protein
MPFSRVRDRVPEGWEKASQPAPAIIFSNCAASLLKSQ